MKTKIIRPLAILAILAFALTGCYEVPESIWTPVDPDVENAQTPVISSVDKTFMFTDETLTITGQNFSPVAEENFVYFYAVSEPVVGDTVITKDSLMVDGTYTIVTNFKNITISTSGSDATVSTTIDGVTTTETINTPLNISEYTTTDADQLVMTSVATTPDTSAGTTKMVRTVTSYNNISDWICHSAEKGTILSATASELQVVPPELDVINSKITVQVQKAIAPAHWGYIDLMVRP